MHDIVAKLIQQELLDTDGAQQVRFCFCKKDETLHSAAERLSKLKSR